MDIVSLIFYFIIIVPSSIIHEYAHGWMANQLGDPTAKYAGRLTLNPLVHIDKWGTIILPLILYVVSGGSFIFAYAKPVPYNPYNLKDPKWGPATVAVAGPLANLLVAAIFAVFIRLLGHAALPWAMGAGFSTSYLEMLGAFFSIIVYGNILLAVFNLVPIAPLDGSKILYAILPDRTAVQVAEFMDRFGFFILLIFIFYAFELIQPIIFWLYRLLVGA